MNTGTIAARYARALLKYVLEKGNEDEIFSQVAALQDALGDEKKLAETVPQLSEDMRKFLSLVISSGRKDILVLVLDSFQNQYRKEKGIVRAKLTVADGNSSQLEKDLTEILAKDGVRRVEFQTETDPSLIGGFILQVEDRRMDASVAGDLERIKKELEAINSRLL